MSRYLPLATVAVEHQYFAGSGGPALDFIPTAETAGLINRLGLLVRNSPRVLNIFYDESRLDALRLQTRKGSEPSDMTFKVFANDPAFKNYTEPAVLRSNSILYFESRTDQAKGIVNLHSKDFVSEKDFRNIDQLCDVLPGVINGRDLMIHPDFIVRLDLNAGDFATSPASARGYRIRFNARQTIWKYYLLGNFKKEIGISDLSNQAEFEFTGKESLPGERTALTFRSRDPIPLREQYDLRIQLKDKSVSGGKVLIRRMPVASANQFGKEVIDGRETIVSEIYFNY